MAKSTSKSTAYFMNDSKKGQAIELDEPKSWLDLPIKDKPFNEKKVFEHYYLFFSFHDIYFYSISNDNTCLIYEGLLLLMAKDNATIT